MNRAETTQEEPAASGNSPDQLVPSTSNGLERKLRPVPSRRAASALVLNRRRRGRRVQPESEEGDAVPRSETVTQPSQAGTSGRDGVEEKSSGGLVTDGDKGVGASGKQLEPNEVRLPGGLGTAQMSTASNTSVADVAAITVSAPTTPVSGCISRRVRVSRHAASLPHHPQAQTDGAVTPPTSLPATPPSLPPPSRASPAPLFVVPSVEDPRPPLPKITLSRGRNGVVRKKLIYDRRTYVVASEIGEQGAEVSTQNERSRGTKSKHRSRKLRAMEAEIGQCKGEEKDDSGGRRRRRRRQKRYGASAAAPGFTSAAEEPMTALDPPSDVGLVSDKCVVRDASSGGDVSAAPAESNTSQGPISRWRRRRRRRQKRRGAPASASSSTSAEQPATAVDPLSDVDLMSDKCVVLDASSGVDVSATPAEGNSSKVTGSRRRQRQKRRSASAFEQGSTSAAEEHAKAVDTPSDAGLVSDKCMVRDALSGVDMSATPAEGNSSQVTGSRRRQRLKRRSASGFESGSTSAAEEHATVVDTPSDIGLVSDKCVVRDAFSGVEMSATPEENISQVTGSWRRQQLKRRSASAFEPGSTSAAEEHATAVDTPSNVGLLSARCQARDVSFGGDVLAAPAEENISQVPDIGLLTRVDSFVHRGRGRCGTRLRSGVTSSGAALQAPLIRAARHYARSGRVPQDWPVDTGETDDGSGRSVALSASGGVFVGLPGSGHAVPAEMAVAACPSGAALDAETAEMLGSVSEAAKLSTPASNIQSTGRSKKVKRQGGGTRQENPSLAALKQREYRARRQAMGGLRLGRTKRKRIQAEAPVNDDPLPTGEVLLESGHSGVSADAETAEASGSVSEAGKLSPSAIGMESAGRRRKVKRRGGGTRQENPSRSALWQRAYRARRQAMVDLPILARRSRKRVQAGAPSNDDPLPAGAPTNAEEATTSNGLVTAAPVLLEETDTSSATEEHRTESAGEVFNPLASDANPQQPAAPGSRRQRRAWRRGGLCCVATDRLRHQRVYRLSRGLTLGGRPKRSRTKLTASETAPEPASVSGVTMIAGDPSEPAPIKESAALVSDSVTAGDSSALPARGALAPASEDVAPVQDSIASVLDSVVTGKESAPSVGDTNAAVRDITALNDAPVQSSTGRKPGSKKLRDSGKQRRLPAGETYAQRKRRMLLIRSGRALPLSRGRPTGPVLTLNRFLKCGWEPRRNTDLMPTPAEDNLLGETVLEVSTDVDGDYAETFATIDGEANRLYEKACAALAIEELIDMETELGAGDSFAESYFCPPAESMSSASEHQPVTAVCDVLDPQKADEQPPRKVRRVRSLEEPERSVHIAYRGERGEQVDVIDGFRFVSFSSMSAITRFTRREEQRARRLRRRDRRKANRRAAIERMIADRDADRDVDWDPFLDVSDNELCRTKCPELDKLSSSCSSDLDVATEQDPSLESDAAGTSELPVETSELPVGTSELPVGTSELLVGSSELPAGASEISIMEPLPTAQTALVQCRQGPVRGRGRPRGSRSGSLLLRNNRFLAKKHHLPVACSSNLRSTPYTNIMDVNTMAHGTPASHMCKPSRSGPGRSRRRNPYEQIKKVAREAYAPVSQIPAPHLPVEHDPALAERLKALAISHQSASSGLGIFTCPELDSYLREHSALRVSFSTQDPVVAANVVRAVSPTPTSSQPRHAPPPPVSRPEREAGEPRCRTVLERLTRLGYYSKEELEEGRAKQLSDAAEKAKATEPETRFDFESVPVHVLRRSRRLPTSPRGQHVPLVSRAGRLLPLNGVTDRSLTERRAWDKPTNARGTCLYAYDQHQQLLVRGSLPDGQNPSVSRGHGDSLVDTPARIVRPENVEARVNAWREGEYRVKTVPVDCTMARMAVLAVCADSNVSAAATVRSTPQARVNKRKLVTNALRQRTDKKNEEEVNKASDAKEKQTQKKREQDLQEKNKDLVKQKQQTNDQQVSGTRSHSRKGNAKTGSETDIPTETEAETFAEDGSMEVISANRESITHPPTIQNGDNAVVDSQLMISEVSHSDERKTINEDGASAPERAKEDDEMSGEGLETDVSPHKTPASSEEPPSLAPLPPHRLSSYRREMLRLGHPALQWTEANNSSLVDPQTPCLKEFCRLGCVCSSLTCAWRKKQHCGREECMLVCVCTSSTPGTTDSTSALTATFQTNLWAPGCNPSPPVALSGSETSASVAEGRARRARKVPIRFTKQDVWYEGPLTLVSSDDRPPSPLQLRPLLTLPSHLPIHEEDILDGQYAQLACRIEVRVPVYRLPQVHSFCLFHEVHGCLEYEQSGSCYKPPLQRLQQLGRNVALRSRSLPPTVSRLRHEHTARTMALRKARTPRETLPQLNSCCLSNALYEGALTPLVPFRPRRVLNVIPLPEPVDIREVSRVVCIVPTETVREDDINVDSERHRHYAVRLHNGLMSVLSKAPMLPRVTWRIKPADDIVVVDSSGRQFRNPIEGRGLTPVTVDDDPVQVRRIPLATVNCQVKMGRSRLTSADGAIVLCPNQLPSGNERQHTLLRIDGQSRKLHVDGMVLLRDDGPGALSVIGAAEAASEVKEWMLEAKRIIWGLPCVRSMNDLRISHMLNLLEIKDVWELGEDPAGPSTYRFTVDGMSGEDLPELVTDALSAHDPGASDHEQSNDLAVTPVEAPAVMLGGEKPRVKIAVVPGGLVGSLPADGGKPAAEEESELRVLHRGELTRKRVASADLPRIKLRMEDGKVVAVTQAGKRFKSGRAATPHELVKQQPAKGHLHVAKQGDHAVTTDDLGTSSTLSPDIIFLSADGSVENRAAAHVSQATGVGVPDSGPGVVETASNAELTAENSGHDKMIVTFQGPETDALNMAIIAAQGTPTVPVQESTGQGAPVKLICLGKSGDVSRINVSTASLVSATSKPTPSFRKLLPAQPSLSTSKGPFNTSTPESAANSDALPLSAGSADVLKFTVNGKTFTEKPLAKHPYSVTKRTVSVPASRFNAAPASKSTCMPKETGVSKPGPVTKETPGLKPTSSSEGLLVSKQASANMASTSADKESMTFKPPTSQKCNAAKQAQPFKFRVIPRSTLPPASKRSPASNPAPASKKAAALPSLKSVLNARPTNRELLSTNETTQAQKSLNQRALNENNGKAQSETSDLTSGARLSFVRMPPQRVQGRMITARFGGKPSRWNMIELDRLPDLMHVDGIPISLTKRYLKHAVHQVKNSGRPVSTKVNGLIVTIVWMPHLPDFVFLGPVVGDVEPSAERVAVPSDGATQPASSSRAANLVSPAAKTAPDPRAKSTPGQGEKTISVQRPKALTGSAAKVAPDSTAKTVVVPPPSKANVEAPHPPRTATPPPPPPPALPPPLPAVADIGDPLTLSMELSTTLERPGAVADDADDDDIVVLPPPPPRAPLDVILLDNSDISDDELVLDTNVAPPDPKPPAATSSDAPSTSASSDCLLANLQTDRTAQEPDPVSATNSSVQALSVPPSRGPVASRPNTSPSGDRQPRTVEGETPSANPTAAVMEDPPRQKRRKQTLHERAGDDSVPQIPRMSSLTGSLAAAVSEPSPRARVLPPKGSTAASQSVPVSLPVRGRPAKKSAAVSHPESLTSPPARARPSKGLADVSRPAPGASPRGRVRHSQESASVSQPAPHAPVRHQRDIAGVSQSAYRPSTHGRVRHSQESSGVSQPAPRASPHAPARHQRDISGVSQPAPRPAPHAPVRHQRDISVSFRPAPLMTPRSRIQHSPQFVASKRVLEQLLFGRLENAAPIRRKTNFVVNAAETEVKAQRARLSQLKLSLWQQSQKQKTLLNRLNRQLAELPLEKRIEKIAEIEDLLSFVQVRVEGNDLEPEMLLEKKVSQQPSQFRVIAPDSGAAAALDELPDTGELSEM